MPYTAERPPQRESEEQLKARIPGWGVDADPAVRPAVPRERFDPAATGAHWVFPDRQQETAPRERSIEHRMLTPVFGTSTPLHGVSGVIRRFAYRRYSEGRAAHWLLLIAADRVDAAGSHVRSMFSSRPDNPITETGVLGERSHRPIRSRFGRKRSDLKHAWMDPIIVGAPWLVSAGLLALLASRGRRR